MNDRREQGNFGDTLRGAMRGALDWRLLALFAGTVLWTTLVATFPAWRVLAGVLDESPRAKEIASAFDLLAFEDMGWALNRSSAPVTGGFTVATIFGALSWPFLAGMAMGAARSGHPRSFAAWIEGGIAYYVRMLRIGLVAIVPFAIIGVVGGGAFRGARQYARHAILESQATLAWRAALAATFIAFVFLHATIEAGRAAFGADDELRSGWKAWLRGVKLTVQDPLRVLGAYLSATAISLAVTAVLLIARLRVSGPSGFALVTGFVLTQLAVASLGWGRTARLFALTALAQARAGTIAIPEEPSDALPDDVRAAPKSSMFNELGERKPIARRG